MCTQAAAAPTRSILTINLLFNSVVITPGTLFMTIDIKYFYLNTPMDQFEYMKLKLNNLPEDFVDRYQLKPKADKSGQVYVETNNKIVRAFPSRPAGPATI